MLLPALAFAAEVKNVQVYQEGNQAVFTYDLVGDETSDSVRLTLTVGGQEYRQDQLHLSGDIGTVRPGTGKKVVWDVLKDFPRGVGGDLRWVLEGSGVIVSRSTSQRFTDNGDGTVTDRQTGLVWQQQDDGEKRNWADAGRYCAQLSLGGHSNWRLPDKDELSGIVEKSRTPTIDAAFVGAHASIYWSSSSYAGSPGSAWGVNFYGGYVGYNVKSNSYYVRCVR